jgi:UDP-N-acetylglucosamine 2-epimerase (non-hydrolysing)
LDFAKLLAHARFVMTDSGGVQEEATVLDTPCLTLRDNTERPCTIEAGTNRLVGRDTQRIIEAADAILGDQPIHVAHPEKWDGLAARRIVDVLSATKSC